MDKNVSLTMYKDLKMKQSKYLKNILIKCSVYPF